MSRPLRRLSLALLFAGLLCSFNVAYGAAYYSTGAPVVATPVRSCTTVLGAQVCTGNVEVTTGATVDGLALAASVYIQTVGPNSVLRLRLSHVAPGGYRAGVLVSTTSSLLGLNLLGAVTLRTYLSTAPNAATPRDVQVVSGSVLQAQLLAGQGLPQQLELLSTQAFDEVEVEFGAALALGLAMDVRYAYGVSPNSAGLPLTGYLSRFDPATTTLATKYDAGNSCLNVVAPEQAVDNDLDNYASFASLAAVNCNGQLRVKLNGTAPGTYRAGFVVGRANDLLDAGILTNLVLRSYYQGAPAEQASSAGLLSLSVLPDGRSYVSFQATQPFDEVSIERTGLVTLLDNLRLYYGLGLPDLNLPPTVYSNFATPAGHYQEFASGLACVGCGVLNPDSAAALNLNKKATLQKTLGGITSIGLRLDLNGPGRAGNRAGVELGRSSALDVSTLQYVTLATYNANNELLETATGSSLLSLVVLPNNRRRVTFNTTANFAKVSIQLGSGLSALDTNEVFYAFADSTDGTFRLTTPAAPLPVSLSSFGARRLADAGTVEVRWTTASEQHSAYFVVERSVNPAAGFQAVGKVAAAGSSSLPQQYHLLDAAANSTSTLYYRLRQVDEDGQVALSKVVVLNAAATSASFSVYPNPVAAATGRVSIQLGTAPAFGASLNLYSSLGQLLARQPLGDTAGETSLLLPAGLAAGVYQVVLRDASGQRTATQRLVVE